MGGLGEARGFVVSQNRLTEIEAELRESISLHEDLLQKKDILINIDKLILLIRGALQGKGKIIFAGNGGSFGDSQHLATEFISRFKMDRNPLPAIALGTNSSLLTAIGNDFGFDQVFSRELKAIAQPKDIFIPISTSGNSENIINAVKVALEIDITTIALTGRKGGKLSDLCQCIKVPSDNTARIQECHILIGHIICGKVEEEYFRKTVLN